MVLGALGCVNNAVFERKEGEKKYTLANIVLDAFIICQKLRHVQVIKKKIILIDL